MRKFNFKVSVMSIFLCLCMIFLNGCVDEEEHSNGNNLNVNGNSSWAYPIATMPEEAKNDVTDKVNVVNKVVLSNKKLDFDKTNEIIGNYTFNIYYDNSEGCFMSYAKMDANSEMKSVFQKTMRSFRSAFDCAKSYKSLITQADLKTGKLVWKEMPNKGNIFDDYANMNIYTPTWAGNDYDSNKPPIVMWLDAVESNTKKGEDADTAISVYMSDLKENGGALASCGTRVKKILDSSPERQLDFLIISYVLPFTGSISGYSIDKDGNSSDKDVTYTVKEMVDNYYYALAFGPHEALAMFDHKVKKGLSELEKTYDRKLNVKSYMYRDIFYSQDETITYDVNDVAVTDNDIVKNNPVTFTLNDGKGNAAEISSKASEEKNEESAESEEKNDDVFDDLNNEPSAEPSFMLVGDMFDEENQAAGGDDIFGDGNATKQILPNLELLKGGELSQYIEGQPSKNTYAFKYVAPVREYQWQCAAALNNSEIYEFDVQNAVSYVYVPQTENNDIMVTEEEEFGWLPGDSVRSRGINVKVTEDNVIVGSDDMLDSSKVAVVVSVPVVYKYKHVVSHYEIKKVDEDFNNWVDRCNVPEKTAKGKEYEKLTHTLFFDEFIDKITGGYKDISESGQKKLIKTDDPESFTSVVDRVNIIIVADPRTCNGM